jgi:hypothetical protein
MYYILHRTMNCVRFTGLQRRRQRGRAEAFPEAVVLERAGMARQALVDVPADHRVHLDEGGGLILVVGCDDSFIRRYAEN